MKKDKLTFINSRSYIQWIILSLISAAIIAVLYFFKIPAASLLGAIFGGIIMAIFGKSEIKVPDKLFQGAQSILGCMIAGMFTVSLFGNIIDHWLIILISIFFMLLCSFSIGYILTVRGVFPGSTAIWGTWPGAASVMVVLSELYGGDIRLVAFMQYLRVVIVALTSSIIVMIVGTGSAATALPLSEQLFSNINVYNFFITLIFAFACSAIAHFFKIPSGSLILSMIIGAILINTGILNLEIPKWFMMITYVIIGWSIGLRFTREIVGKAINTFPKLLILIFLLIAICAGVSVIVSNITGVDFLTAYLALSPGGSDSVAIIAASCDVEISFVMSIQIMRFMIILFMGPAITRYTMKYIKAGKKTI